MNYRSKSTAMVLAFFLGLFGAHWFYLGRPNWGILYLVIALGSWPAALMIVTAVASFLPAIGALALLLAWAAQALLLVLVIYDFCCLLSMEPRRFDLDYNR